MQTFLLSLKKTTKLKGILEIVTAATEFEDIQTRRHEERILSRIYDRVPVKLAEVNFESPHFKAFILLQAHFSRMQLPVDLAKDQELVLKKVLVLLSACVDVLSSEAHLNAMSAMEMSQMVVQSMWDRDSPLKQIPHFDNSVIESVNAAGINDVFEFMDAMDPAENPNYDALIKGMGLSNQQLSDAAKFTNDKYPNVELNFTLEDAENVIAGEPSYLTVTLDRDIDDDEEDSSTTTTKIDTVHAPFYPAEKHENWWLVVGEEGTKTLLSIKKISFIGKEQVKVRLDFTVLSKGKHDLTLFLMCDSYVGVDQAPTFSVDAAEGEEEDDDDVEEDEDAEMEG
jgi:pre-mRNA-splicing helicase BRR2